ncbi:MAG: hypothetical protein CL535_16540 [Ahrensia sp.]|nr:hypothetical protein [Ahrensia sp.]MBV48182.1 hypothetical protein [Roseobacter sp.]MBV48283.1 hypothetical protein [Roseobacter sp.]|tara:strand:- start:149196 stop:149774 length:579 start_codon:yes stop_codon:yes gene_type:complete
MAQLGSKFNATEHDTEQRDDYPELPNGIYRLEMEASEIKENPRKNGNGTNTLLKTTFNVLEPAEYEGRKLFNNYNLEHESSQAQEIGQKQFAALCRAVEIAEVDDSEELHFRAFTATVKLGKPSKEKDANGNPAYPARAEIKRYYFPDEGNVPEPAIDDNQPKAAPAKDNRQAASNDNKPAAASGQKKRPWG